MSVHNTNLVMLIYCSKTKGVDIRGGLIGLNTNIKMHLEIQAKPSTFLKE